MQSDLDALVTSKINTILTESSSMVEHFLFDLNLTSVPQADGARSPQEFRLLTFLMQSSQYVTEIGFAVNQELWFSTIKSQDQTAAQYIMGYKDNSTMN